MSKWAMLLTAAIVVPTTRVHVSTTGARTVYNSTHTWHSEDDGDCICDRNPNCVCQELPKDFHDVGKPTNMNQSNLALPINRKDDYALIRKFIAKRHPGYDVVFVNEDETLLNPGAEKTPVSTFEAGKPGLRIWMVKRSV